MTSTAHTPAHLHRHRARRRLRRLLVSALVATLTVPAGGLLTSASAAGTTYYVDPAAGCSDSGPGSSSQPFCALTPAAKVATAGDTVQVAAGEYREQVTAVSGVTYRATSPSAVVLGSDSLGGATWAATAGSAWTTVLPGTTVPAQVFAGASRLARADSAATTSTNSWFFDAPTRTLSVDLGGASPAPSDQLEVSLRQYGFLARSTTGVVIDGFAVRRANGSGVMLDSSSAATVRQVRASESGSYGVNDVAGSGNTISGVTATNNLSIGIRLSGTTNGSVISSTASRNGFHGVSVQGGTGARVAGVTADHNVRPGTRVAAGIDVSSSSKGALVERNRTFSNDDSGVEIYTGSSGAVVRRNLTYDNGDHGIDISNAADASVVSNTVVGNLASGLNVEGTSTGATVRDNIAADNAVSTPRSKGDIRVDKTSVAGSSIDRDLVFQSAGADPLYEWNGVTYTSLAALRSATGQEAHGRSGAPGFVSLPGRNLALTAGSPALDAADSGAPGWTANDFAGKAPVDQPDRADTGAGPVTYADIGALELTTVTVVDNAPQAAITATPAAATTDSPVKLDASGSTDDHGVTGYTFKCDTSSTPVTQTAATYTCTYPTAGTVHPSVTATDAAGHTSSAGATVTVTAAVVPAPTAALDVSPATVRQGGKVTLDGSRSTAGSAKAPLTKYTFDCGPGTAFDRTTSKADCTYRSTGRFTATLKVTDSLGRSATATRTVTVTAGARPHARLSVSDSTPRRRQVVRANASRSYGDAVSPVTAWKFRCGRAHATRWSTRTTKRCVFRSTGRKVVRVWVRNDLGLVDTAYRVVRVHR